MLAPLQRDLRLISELRIEENKKLTDRITALELATQKKAISLSRRLHNCLVTVGSYCALLMALYKLGLFIGLDYKPIFAFINRYR